MRGVERVVREKACEDDHGVDVGERGDEGGGGGEVYLVGMHGGGEGGVGAGGLAEEQRDIEVLGGGDMVEDGEAETAGLGGAWLEGLGELGEEGWWRTEMAEGGHRLNLHRTRLYF